MEIDYLKETLFDEFNRFEDYDNIIADLRSLNSCGELSNEEYDIILENYENWLKEWSDKMENNEEKYPKIDENNLENSMGVCPYCKEQDLEYGAIQLEGECAYFPYKCNNCGLEGEEWYSMEFTGHNVYDENGELIEL